MRLRIPVSAALLACTLPLQAQERPDDPAQGHAVWLDPVTLITDRSGKTLREATQTVDVVGADEITARVIDDLETLTRHMPGIAPGRQVSAADPFGGTTSVQIRGVEGNRIQFQIDGGRVPERIIDGSRDYLDFNFTKQAEVLRGPASVLWGADALGGVVALETISADDVIEGDARQGGRATMSHGSVDRASNMSLAWGQRLGARTRLLVAHARGHNTELRLKHAPADGGQWGCTRPVATGSVDCGKFNPLDRVSSRTLIKLDHDIDDSQRLTFSLDRLHRRSEVDVRTSLATSATGQVVENRRTRIIERSRYGVEYRADFAGGPISALRAGLGWSPSGYRQRGVQRSILPDSTHQVQFDQLRYAEDFLELDIQATSELRLGGAAHRLTWGLDADRAKTTYDIQRRRVNTTTGADTHVPPAGFNFADGTTTRADLYVQDEISLMGGKLMLTPGLRYATYRMDPRVNGAVTGTDPSLYETKRETRLLGSFGASYDLDDRHTVWAHYGEGFKMPTFQQLFTSSVSGNFDLVPAPWLRPESVRSHEVGVRGDYDTAVWSVNAFKADYTDFIESFWFVPGTNDISYRNLSEVRTWGIEAEGSWQVNPRLRMSGSLAWMQGRARATAGAAETVHVVPPLSGTIGLDYTLAHHDVTLSATGQFASKVKSKPGNFAPGGYGVVDVGARIGLSDTASLNIGVQNVFDRAYYTMGAAGSSLTPGPANTSTVPPGLFTGAGRSLTVSLDLRF